MAMDDVMPRAARALIARVAPTAATLIEPASATKFDASRGERFSGRETEHEVTTTPPLEMETGYGEDTQEVGETMVFLAADGLPAAATPQTGWKIEIAGQRWEIMKVKPYRSGELVAAYGLVLGN